MIALLPLAGLLLCAGGAWLFGLGIRRRVEAPSLTARIHRHRRRCAFLYLLTAIGVTYAVSALTGSATLRTLIAPLGILYAVLCAIACAAGDYPLRRAAFGERIPFGTSVLFTLRTALGMGAFWIVLVAVPYVVRASGPHAWPAAGAAFAVLLLWAWRSQPVMLALLGVRPIENPALRARFDEIAARSSAAAPTVGRFGPSGGAWVNAFALPHVERPAVAFTTALLERLTTDESGAIFAHEIAHLEDYDARRLRAIGRMQLGVMAFACVVSPLAALAGVPWTVVVIGWPVGFVVFLLRRAAAMKKKETRSDLRAVELCGDAETVARALEKLHALNHVPRRLDVDTEQASTHPSLARRLADIRRGSAVPSAATATTAFRARDGKRVVVFEADHLVALRLGAADRDAPDLGDIAGLAERAERRDALAYEDLVTLHVTLERSGGMLRAVERDGTERRVPLDAADLDACGRAIDGIDHRFAPLETAKAPPKVVAALLVAAACLGIVAARATDVIAMLLVLCAGVGAMFRMRRSWFGALGAGAVAAALAAIGVAAARGATETWLLLGAAAAAGVFCFRLRLPPGSPRRLALLFALGGAPLLASAVHALSADHPVFAIADVADRWPGLFLPLVMAAGALVHAGGRRARAVAAVLAVAGLSHHALGSDWFLREIAHDPVARVLPAPVLDDAPFEVLRETEVEGRFRGLTLSPSGLAFATIATHRVFVEGARHADTVHVADFAGRTLALPALAVRFVDDRRLLVLQETRPPHLAVQLRTLDDPYRVVWHHAIEDAPPLVHADLSVVDGTWTVVVDEARYRGTVGGTGATRDRAPAPFHAPASALRIDVRDGVCVADGRGRRRFWLIERGALSPGFELPAGMDWAHDGTRIASVRADAIDIVDVESRRGVTIPLDRKADWNTAVALCAGGVGFGFQDAGVFRVVLLQRPR